MLNMTTIRMEEQSSLSMVFSSKLTEFLRIQPFFWEGQASSVLALHPSFSLVLIYHLHFLPTLLLAFLDLPIHEAHFLNVLAKKAASLHASFP